MKNSPLLAIATTLAAVSLATVTGCTYDVTDPPWDQPYTSPPTSTITQIQPSSAPAGVNTILITGQNLRSVPDANGVFFGTVTAEVVQKSATGITVRRPNLVVDSCTVMVVPDSALAPAKIRFGKIDQVVQRIGSFNDDIDLAALTLDDAGNVIVVSGLTPVAIWRVASDGSKTPLATSGLAIRPPFDAAFRNGVLYLEGNNREIQQVNMTTGVASRWTQLPQGRIVKVGTFDANGYYYAGGAAGVDLCIIPPNPPATLTLAQIKLSGFYAAEEVLALRASGRYLYVASRPNSATPVKIWRHLIDTAGTLGAQQAVLDLNAFPAFSSRLVKSISPSSDGLIYLTTDAANPLLVYSPSAGTLDYFYKNILPPYGKLAVWGNTNYLHMISGDADNADTALRWNVVRVNLGTTGTPYP